MEVYVVDSIDSNGVNKKHIGKLDDKNSLIKWFPHRQVLMNLLESKSPTLSNLYMQPSQWSGTIDWPISNSTGISFYEIIKTAKQTDAYWRYGLHRAWLCDYIFRSQLPEDPYSPFKFMAILYCFLGDAFFSSTNTIDKNYTLKKEMFMERGSFRSEDVWFILLLHHMRPYAKDLYHSVVLGETSHVMTCELFAHHLLTMLNTISENTDPNLTPVFRWNIKDLASLCLVVFTVFHVHSHWPVAYFTKLDTIIDNQSPRFMDIFHSRNTPSSMDLEHFYSFIYNSRVLSDVFKILLSSVAKFQVSTWIPIGTHLLGDLSTFFSRLDEIRHEHGANLTVYDCVSKYDLRCFSSLKLNFLYAISNTLETPNFGSDFERAGYSNVKTKDKPQVLLLNTPLGIEALNKYVIKTSQSAALPQNCDLPQSLLQHIFKRLAHNIVPTLSTQTLWSEIVKIWSSLDQYNLVFRLQQEIENDYRLGLFVRNYTKYAKKLYSDAHDLYNLIQSKDQTIEEKPFESTFYSHIPNNRRDWYEHHELVHWDRNKDCGEDLREIEEDAEKQWRWLMFYLFQQQVRENPKLKILPKDMVRRLHGVTIYKIHENLLSIIYEHFNLARQKLEDLASKENNILREQTQTYLDPSELANSLKRWATDTKMCRADGLNNLMFFPWLTEDVYFNISSNISLNKDVVSTQSILQIHPIIDDQLLPYYYLLSIQQLCTELKLDGVVIQTQQNGFDVVILLERAVHNDRTPPKRKPIHLHISTQNTSHQIEVSERQLLDHFKNMVESQIRCLLESIKKQSIMINNTIPSGLNLYE